MIEMFLKIFTDESGKKTPEDVIKRHGGISHGKNPDLMAEMREKRASMVQQVLDIGNF